MNCQEFKNWILEQERRDHKSSKSAYEHMALCKACKSLYELDDLTEDCLKASLEPAVPPAELLSRIRMKVQPVETGGPRSSKQSVFKRYAPAFAVAAIAVLLVLNPFSTQIGNLGEIGSYALANHTNTNANMAFRADEISDVSGWFSKRLGFPVQIPNLEKQGFIFLGGRECYLGKKKAAYLYYDNQGQKTSLFIINSKDLDFDIEKQKTYAIYDRGYEIKIWMQEKLCYALVK